MESNEEQVVPSSHFFPRTRTGRRVVLLFLSLFALAEPPIVFRLANRVEPFVFGMPFLYAYLLAVYVSLIAALIWGLRKGL